MEWPIVALVLGLLGAAFAFLATGATLRGAAAEQVERRHEAERRLDALLRDGLDAQLRDARAKLEDAGRLDASRVAEIASLRDALGAAGGPAADRVLLDLPDEADAAPGAADPAGGLPA